MGAGLSAAAGLPTFRGTNGLWTADAHLAKTDPSLKHWRGEVAGLPQPTDAHRALVELEKRGYIHHLASQNYDDILGRAGFPRAKMGELHGNIFIERCCRCDHEYHRDFEVELASAKDHETGRFCDAVFKNGKICEGELHDTIIHFGENLPWNALTLSNAKFVGSDLSIAIGTSLRVEPAASMPFKAKSRQRVIEGSSTVLTSRRSVIINLQPTLKDAHADLCIYGRCDDVMQRLMVLLANFPAKATASSISTAKAVQLKSATHMM